MIPKMSNGKHRSCRITSGAAVAATFISQYFREVIEESARFMAKEASGGFPDDVTASQICDAACMVLGSINGQSLVDPVRPSLDQAAASPDDQDKLSGIQAEIQRLGECVAADLHVRGAEFAQVTDSLSPLPQEAFPGRPWVFVSYARGVNDQMVESIVAGIKTKKLNVFVDKQSIEPGDDRLHAIGRCLLECKVLLAVISGRFLGSSHCQAELLSAMMLRKHLVPAIFGITKEELPGYLTARQCIEIGDVTQLEELVNLIDQLCSSSFGDLGGKRRLH